MTKFFNMYDETILDYPLKKLGVSLGKFFKINSKDTFLYLT